MKTLIIDGNDLILGRLASFVAKRLLEGEHVVIVNAGQVVVSGRKDAIRDGYMAWMETRTLTNPRKGPFHLKRSDDLVRMTVRGMLPFSKPHGRDAFHRLRAHIGVPEELAGKELTPVPDAGLDRLGTRRFIRIGELSRYLGANVT